MTCRGPAWRRIHDPHLDLESGTPSMHCADRRVNRAAVVGGLEDTIAAWIREKAVFLYDCKLHEVDRVAEEEFSIDVETASPGETRCIFRDNGRGGRVCVFGCRWRSRTGAELHDLANCELRLDGVCIFTGLSTERMVYVTVGPRGRGWYASI